MPEQSEVTVKDTASVELREVGHIADPVAGDPREYAARIWANANESLRTGVWSCEVGEFPGKHPDTEICYFLEGRATLVSAAGSRTEAGPGSVIVFPAGWKGNWVVHEPVRKVYVIAAAS